MGGIPWNPSLPNLSSENHRITSPATSRYNCIAWAANCTTSFWWPLRPGFWPQGVPRKETLLWNSGSIYASPYFLSFIYDKGLQYACYLSLPRVDRGRFFCLPDANRKKPQKTTIDAAKISQWLGQLRSMWLD